MSFCRDRVNRNVSRIESKSCSFHMNFILPRVVVQCSARKADHTFLQIFENWKHNIVVAPNFKNAFTY